MALDWKKEISLSSVTELLKKKPSLKQKGSLPSKTTMNLALNKKKKTWDVKKIIPIIVVVLIVIALFVKFGILDFYAKIDDAQVRLAEQQSRITEARASLGNYQEVAERYEEYGFYGNTDESNTLDVDAMDAMQIVNNSVLPFATVLSCDYSDNVLTLAVSTDSLDQIGSLTSKLYENDLVKNVSVSTATAKQEDGALRTSMKVKLGYGDEVEDDAEDNKSNKSKK